jgi:F-type H+-transporting ATPase subunit c
MRNMKNLKYVFFLLALLAFASPIFAQATSTAPATSTDWNRAAAGISMAIASGLCALGQGKAIAGAAEGLARNPAASANIRFALILGLILIESLALYTFAIIFVKVVPAS